MIYQKDATKVTRSGWCLLKSLYLRNMYIFKASINVFKGEAVEYGDN